MITKYSPLRPGLLLTAMIAGFAVCLVACSGQDGGAESPYAGWKHIQRQNVKLYYPSGHPHERDLPQLAQGYASALRKICREMDMPVPAETLVVYHYTGPGHGYEVTGARWPFVKDTIIHYWQPGYLGATLTEYLLTRFAPDETRHAIMNRGLQTFFDFSGINHNERVLTLLEAGHLPSLDSLASMEHIDPQEHSRQTAAAGSFIGFLHGSYGMPVIKQLYQSVLPFDEAVVQVTGRTLDQLEQEWHQALYRWKEWKQQQDSLAQDSEN
ncbi:hypothetical protein GF356_08890 [candidate division GN15 bacterium]|nr:hypothetical protein [candidate division GN15 bacterium]